MPLSKQVAKDIRKEDAALQRERDPVFGGGVERGLRAFEYEISSFAGRNELERERLREGEWN